MDILIKIIVLLTLFGCSQTVPKNPRSSQAEDRVLSDKINLGQALATDQKSVDFDSLESDAIVLIFASDVCSTCAAEAKYWKKELEAGLPQNIYFAHFMIGGSREDSADWKDYYQINWDVLYDVNDNLFRQYCSKVITPCFVIKNNKTNQITQTYNLLRKEEVERITGQWIF